jgi:hypothetical protein
MGLRLCPRPRTDPVNISEGLRNPGLRTSERPCVGGPVYKDGRADPIISCFTRRWTFLTCTFGPSLVWGSLFILNLSLVFVHDGHGEDG